MSPSNFNDLSDSQFAHLRAAAEARLVYDPPPPLRVP